MKMTRFTLAFDSDCQGELPRILIRDAKIDLNGVFAELFLEPIPLVENPDSFNDEHWEFPHMAKSTVWLMNEYS